MSDQSEDYVPPPVMPSPVEGAGGSATRTIHRADTLSRQNVALRKALTQMMVRDGLNNMTIGAFEMAHADPALLTVKIDTNGNAHLQLDS